MSETEAPKIITGRLIKINESNGSSCFDMFGSEMFLGRNFNAPIRLDHPSVSRKHCVFRHTPEGWTVKDNKSQNGTYVDGISIGNEEFHLLKDKAIIHLGIPSISDCAGLAFCFEKCNSEEQVKEPKNEGLESTSKRKLPVEVDESVPHQKKRIFDENSKNSDGSSFKPETIGSCSSSCSNGFRNVPTVKRSPSKKNSVLGKSKNADKFYEFLQEMKSGTNLKEEQKDSNESESLIPVENDFHMEYDAFLFSQAFSYSQGKVICPEKDESFQKNCLQAKINELQDQVRALEVNLQEKDGLIQSQIQKEQQVRTNLQQITENVKKALEEEFCCNICTELLVKATVLDCSHTFCEHCILEWKKKKKICPICRNRITKETKVLVLDHIIDKAVTIFYPENVEKRRELLMSREKKKKPVAAKKSPKRRRRRWGINLDLPHQENDLPLSDATSEYLDSDAGPSSELQSLPSLQLMARNLLEEAIQLNLEDNFSDSSVEGDGYYPGYGRCFNCGRRGHWANGCPD